MVSIKDCALCLIVLSLIIVSPVKAEEFGNVFSGFDNVEEASRKASTEALDGVISILEAIKQRESKTGDGTESAAAAAESFALAESQMTRLVAMEDFPSFKFNEKETDVLNQNLGRYWQFKEFGYTQIKDFKALFQAFRRETGIMVQLAKSATQVSEGDQMFAIFSGNRLGWYFAVADVVTVISKGRR